jgi:hypothetical protein
MNYWEDWYVFDVEVNGISKATCAEDLSKPRWQKQESVGEANVSTVFLGLDHNFGGGQPVLFETMVFGGEHDGYQSRACTYEEALAMHDRVVAMLNEPPSI